MNLDSKKMSVNTLVVMIRKLNSTIKYDPNTRSNSKSNVTLATCNNKGTDYLSSQ
jgi:hypothetical protein